MILLSFIFSLGAVAQLGRPLRRLHPFGDFLWREATACHAFDGGLEHLTVVGQLLRDRRMPGADDAEHVAFMNERTQHLLDQIAGARGLAELQVEIVDEDQEDTARRVVRRAPLRQNDAFLHWRRRRRKPPLKTSMARISMTNSPMAAR